MGSAPTRCQGILNDVDFAGGFLLGIPSIRVHSIYPSCVAAQFALPIPAG